VIDLTLSDDDEDDQPISRAPKRQLNGYSTPQGMFTARNSMNGL
jgi:hypothetical protein